MKTAKRFIMILSLGVVIFAFQNCSEPQFTNLDAPNLSKISGAPEEEASGALPPVIVIPIGDPSVGHPIDEGGVVYDDGSEDEDTDDADDNHGYVAGVHDEEDDNEDNNKDDNENNEDNNEDDNNSRNICSLGNRNFAEAILNVKIKAAYLSGQNGEEVRVHTTAGQLLALSNGQIVISTRSNIEAHQLRLVLEDTGNTITSSNGVTYPLTTPSAQQSGLKINLGQSENAIHSFEADKTYVLTFNIDLAKRVVQAGRSGKCILKPTLFATKIESSSNPSENPEVAANN